MYSLDINFLNDRPEYSSAGTSGSRPTATPVTGSRVPMFLGILVGIALPALVGGYWFVLQNQIQTLDAEKARLNATIGDLNEKLKQADVINAQAAEISKEADAIAGVFNFVKPWSALLQDISERVPPSVQLDLVQESGGVINLSGTARSYNEVNDFLLLLQKSPFLSADKTQLQGTQMVAFSGAFTLTGFPKEKTPSFKFPEVASYKIVTNLSQLGANDLIRELERKGSIGLVTRIRTLQEKGVIK
ncbi:hypothetical protein BST81_15145 [Leptolyngbya sp. 'hensonii']|uniref:PilN domain-containing protein n=1 Tax=Leptolyngbya sp. 'hensonii' TaxID=1922337 RepID=UPI00094F89F9|nr:PilN domain-containing protein [Leptolyngbya sp. 'hensonii']OLP17656.1 hypothetical protein BST81_15145 [Leptolyngbya sp. 'hensonii']